jgi:hypothetical protein
MVPWHLGQSFDRISILPFSRRAAAFARSGRLQLHSARSKRFAEQALDLGIDASKVGCGAALDRRP